MIFLSVDLNKRRLGLFKIKEYQYCNYFKVKALTDRILANCLINSLALPANP